jgi:hypothetical protein
MGCLEIGSAFEKLETVSSCFTLLRSKQALDMAFGKHFLIE